MASFKIPMPRRGALTFSAFHLMSELNVSDGYRRFPIRAGIVRLDFGFQAFVGHRHVVVLRVAGAKRETGLDEFTRKMQERRGA